MVYYLRVPYTHSALLCRLLVVRVESSHKAANGVAATVATIKQQATAAGYHVYQPLAQCLANATTTPAPAELTRILLGPDRPL